MIRRSMPYLFGSLVMLGYWSSCAAMLWEQRPVMITGCMLDIIEEIGPGYVPTPPPRTKGMPS